MENKGSFLILLIVVAVLSIGLAGIAGYLLIFGGQRPVQEANLPNNQIAQEKHIDYEKVQKFKPFNEESQIISLKSSPDDKTRHAIRIKVEFLIADEKSLEQITFRQAEVKDFLITFFRQKTFEEMDDVANIPALKEEILKELNNKFLPGKGEKINEKFLDINFEDWFIQ